MAQLLVLTCPPKSPDRHFSRSGNAQSNASALHLEHLDRNLFTNSHCFADLPCQN